MKRKDRTMYTMSFEELDSKAKNFTAKTPEQLDSMTPEQLTAYHDEINEVDSFIENYYNPYASNCPDAIRWAHNDICNELCRIYKRQNNKGVA